MQSVCDGDCVCLWWRWQPWRRYEQLYRHVFTSFDDMLVMSSILGDVHTLDLRHTIRLHWIVWSVCRCFVRFIESVRGEILHNCQYGAIAEQLLQSIFANAFGWMGSNWSVGLSANAQINYIIKGGIQGNPIIIITINVLTMNSTFMVFHFCIYIFL